jgi:hypothetical protein
MKIVNGNKQYSFPYWISQFVTTRQAYHDPLVPDRQYPAPGLFLQNDICHTISIPGARNFKDLLSAKILFILTK